MTIAAELRRAATKAGGVPYLVSGAEVVTYAEHWRRVRRFADALAARGIGRGTRVAIWAANDIPSATAMQAVVAAGATIIPLTTRLTCVETAQIIGQSGAELIMAPETLLGRRYVDEAVELCGREKVVCLEGTPPADVVSWRDLIQRGSADALEAVDLAENGDESQIVVTQFTSGTTGQPKGVQLRQGPMVATARSWSRIVGLGYADVTPLLYPLSHVGGFKTGLTSSLVVRATVVLLPVVSVAATVEVLQQHPVTVMNAPPAILRDLLDAHVSGTLTTPRSLRTIVTGSSVVPPRLVLDLKAQFGIADVINAYGLTEASGVCSMTRRGDDIERVCHTLGRAIPGVEFRVAAPNEGGIGELEVSTPAVMVGYLGDDAATAAAVHDGWLRTGDTGWIDSAGYIHLAGRSSDVILVGGYNVYPAEVEVALEKHPEVCEAAVVSAPDERLGEVPVAFVVTRAGLAHSDLERWLSDRLANYKRPRRYWLVDALPRGELGKISKRLLRDRAESEGAGVPE